MALFNWDENSVCKKHLFLSHNRSGVYLLDPTPISENLATGSAD